MRVGQLITAKMLERTLEASFKAPASSGIWDWRCTYDAMEASAPMPCYSMLRFQSRRLSLPRRLMNYLSGIPWWALVIAAGWPALMMRTRSK